MLSVLTAPVKVVPERMKVPMVAMVLSPVSRDRAHRGLDGDLQAAGDRRRTRHEPEQSGGWRPGGFLGSRGMRFSAGEESCPVAIAAEAIEASAVLRPDQAIERQRGRVQTIGESLVT